MATGTISGFHNSTARGIVEMVWTTTTNGSGFAMNAPDYPDKTVHITGPTGGSTTVVIEGSNDAPTGEFITLTDPQGNAISKTAASVESILENPKYIRPTISNATGPTVVVRIVARGDK